MKTKTQTLGLVDMNVIRSMWLIYCMGIIRSGYSDQQVNDED